MYHRGTQAPFRSEMPLLSLLLLLNLKVYLKDVSLALPLRPLITVSVLFYYLDLFLHSNFRFPFLFMGHLYNTAPLANSLAKLLISDLPGRNISHPLRTMLSTFYKLFLMCVVMMTVRHLFTYMPPVFTDGSKYNDKIVLYWIL